VVSIIGIGKTSQPGPSLPGIGRKNHKTCSFAQVQTRSRGIKRPAMIFVQNHQRMKTIEGKSTQGIHSSGNHGIHQAFTNQSRAEHNSIGSRGAGGTQCCNIPTKPHLHSNPAGTVPAIMGHNVTERSSQRISASLTKKMLRQVHSPYGSGRDQSYPWGAHIQPGILSRFPHSPKTQQCGTGPGRTDRKPQPLTQLFPGGFHLRNRYLERCVKQRHRPHTGTSLCKSIPMLLNRQTQPGDDTDTSDINIFWIHI